MRILQLHCDYVAYKPKQRALKSVPELSEEEKKGSKLENAVIVFSSFEVGDNEAVLLEAIHAVKKNFDEVKAENLLVYPYAHLSNNLAPPSEAILLLNHFLKLAKEHVCKDAIKSPFGYYKEFELKCKGHPLAELSKSISSQKIESTAEKLGAEKIIVEAVKPGQELVSDSLKQEDKTKRYFKVMTPDGVMHDLDKFDFSEHSNLKTFYDYENKKVRAYSSEPAHMKLMREQELVGLEAGSDGGNLRWYPKGRLVKKVLEKKITDLMVDYGANEIESPIMYDFEHPALKKYLNRFPARQYIVQSDDKNFFLRFAACFGQFLIAHDASFSYKQLPLRLFELTRYSFRREQSGEVSGLRRLRAFTMPDMHTLCEDLTQAKQEFFNQYLLCVDWNNDLGIPFETAFRVQEDFFNENKEFYTKMVAHIGRPVLFELFDLRYAYFITKFEFNFVDQYGKATSLSTVQIDVENCDTFDLNYTNSNGKKAKPILLHASIPGAIERVVFALLELQGEKIALKQKPMLPTFLSPTQVRLIPINEKQRDYCEQALSELSKHGVRVDYDDRTDTLQSRIREAETEWVPFVAVAGEKELMEGKFNVSIRSSGRQEKLSIKELIELVKNETLNQPFEKLSLPPYLSKRAKYN
ncbi:threonine--tRNA ligase [Candidatus Micrarchaeota archaeon]|nr:threonine--tRNA ligase [Candidatus Micrarchaeota archaeon]